MELCDAALLDTQLEDEAVESAIYNAIRPNAQEKISIEADKLFCCGALLGASVLQAHSAAHVRQLSRPP